MTKFQLPNGSTLFYKDNGIGGRTYYSDVVGAVVLVWDTSLVNDTTLLFALQIERLLQRKN